MRLRDHHKGDLALAALTLTVTAVAAGNEAARWAARRFRRNHPPAGATRRGSKPPPGP
jgi:hypothetical protein